MIRIPTLALAMLAMSCCVARVQLTLPGAPAATPAPHKTAAPDKGDNAPKGDKPDKSEKTSARFVSSLGALADKPLHLNGSQGELVFSVRDKALRIEKLSLAGEVISDPSRKCLIDIVGDAPIATKSLGRPDGLARFEAEIPACAFSFDVLGGAVLAPPQDRACIFQAADCQATPAGLWGPDPTTLHSDAKAVGRRRLRADATAERSLRAIQARFKGHPDGDAISREDSGWASRRADLCRDYVEEATYAFCASRLAQARAALLKARLDGLRRPASTQD